MKKVTFAMLIITFIMYIGLNFFSNESTADVAYDNDAVRDTYLNIMVCNKSQYNMVKKISGEKHNIQYMFNDEQSMKEFKYDSNTVDNVSTMDLFMYSGNNYEPWSYDFIEDLDKSKVGIVNISRGIRTINYTNDSNKTNPYYWTGVEEYKIALYNIKSAIQDKDPKNRDTYEENYNRAIEYIDNSISIYKGKKELLDDYSIIALDEKNAYFLKSIGVNYSLQSPDTLAKYISDKELNLAKVIVIKDSTLEYTSDIYNVVSLQSFDGNKGFEDIIFNDYKQLLSIPLQDKESKENKATGETNNNIK